MRDSCCPLPSPAPQLMAQGAFGGGRGVGDPQLEALTGQRTGSPRTTDESRVLEQGPPGLTSSAARETSGSLTVAVCQFQARRPRLVPRDFEYAATCLVPQFPYLANGGEN